MAGKERAARYQDARPSWYPELSQYAQPSRRFATWQLVNTFVPYFGLVALMVFTIRQGMSYWITLSLAVGAGFLLVRLFIFFHDCCHGSFFGSRRANRILGTITGILTFTPFEDWRRSHLGHHATAGNLDRRGVGDVWTMTVDEYQSAPRLKQLAYRVFRNPIVMFGIGPGFVFLISQRLPHQGARKRERFSVRLTNLAILAIIALASVTVGFKTYVLVQLPVILIAGVIGVWMFYVQHQFEGVYWSRQSNWNPFVAAMKGSSYYKLPRWLQWLTGNIGLHHIHHLLPRIPNYHLQRCYDNIPALQTVKPITVRTSLKSLRLHLWDEDRQTLTGFSTIKKGRKDTVGGG